jgi:flagellar assembly protein FliH
MALLKGVIAGEAIGADEMGRYLAPEQRAYLLARLTDEVAGRTAAIVEEARAAAASILRDARAEAEAIRARAQEEGFAAGHSAGYAEGQAAGRAAAEPLAALLTEAVTGADAARRLILEGMEEEVLALALQAAQRVVGAVADSHRDLAARIVREGLRSAPGRVLRIRVNPADAESVSTSLIADKDVLPIHPDDTVEIGGCIIHVEGGTIDLRLDTQMQSIAALLQGDTA